MLSDHGESEKEVRRFIEAPLSEFESVFSRDEKDDLELGGADYPVSCRLKRGAIRFAKGPGGCLLLHVDRCVCEAGDFRVKLLFETGSLVFGSAAELASFWRTSIAVAFGLEAVAPESDEVSSEEDGQDGDVGQTGEAPVQNPSDPGVDEPPPNETRPTLHEEVPRKKRGPKRAPAPPEDGSSQKPSFTVDALASRLSRDIFGQEAALERVASVVVAQMSKQRPTHPGCIALLGPTSVGKTATVELLPAALSKLGIFGTHLFRVDCNELADDIQLTRFLGAPPGYVGFRESTPFFQALERPRCILLLDEIEKAHPIFVQDVLLNLLDRGRLTTPNGRSIVASDSVIALTTNLEISQLELSLHDIPRHDRWVVQRACRSHVLEAGLRPELVARIGAFALYAELDTRSSELAAEKAIRDLASEYELRVTEIDPIVIRVILDIAGDNGLGARALYHAARDLLVDQLVEILATGLSGKILIEAGPPLTIRSARGQQTSLDVPVNSGSVCDGRPQQT